MKAIANKKEKVESLDIVGFSYLRGDLTINSINYLLYFYNDIHTSAGMPVETWIPPNNWTGPNAAVYWSFDRPDGIVLVEGTQMICTEVPLITGQVICAHLDSFNKFCLKNC